MVFALVSYTVAVVAEQRRGRITPGVLAFLTVGVLLDVTATAFMILGIQQGSVHPAWRAGIFLARGHDRRHAALLGRLARSAGPGAVVPRSLHLYTRAAYLWWVAAFITGGLLVAMR